LLIFRGFIDAGELLVAKKLLTIEIIKEKERPKQIRGVNLQFFGNLLGSI
jgi:hypothetical protein